MAPLLLQHFHQLFAGLVNISGAHGNDHVARLYKADHMRHNVDATGLQTFANDDEWPITVGLNFTDTTGIDRLDAKLDRWSGRFDSRFCRNGQRFRVETVCMQAAVATRITSDTIFEISFRSSTGFPVRTAQKSPNFKQIGRRQRMVVKETDGHQTHWLIANWYGDVSVRQDDNRVVLTLDQPLRDGSLKYFELAGNDGRFSNVEATAQGNTITLTAPMNSPATVRYAWKDNPLGPDAYSQGGLPLGPFELKLGQE